MRSDRSLSKPTCILILIAAFLSGGSRAAHAFSTGITGFSGKASGAICNSCHAGGTAPTVSIEGPSTVAPGSTTTYRFTVRSQSATQTSAGLDVAVSTGTLAINSDQNARVTANEVVHNSPKANVESVASWEFTFTAPATAGSVTMFGAGNSVNLDRGTLGDRAAATTLVITVEVSVDTPTPSPTPTPTGDSTRTPTATSGPIPCIGDCDDSGVVAVNELVTGVNIALDRAQVSECPDFDADGSGSVSVNELVSGVNALLRGCDSNL